MIILGVDPGTVATGWGAIKQVKSSPKDTSTGSVPTGQAKLKVKSGFKLLDYGVIATSPKQTAGKRLLELHKKISYLLKRIKPDVLVVEKLYFFKNLKTALPVSEARGVILLAASQQKIKVIELTPLQIKMGVCGYGRADKKQVQRMVQEILCLKKPPKPDDAADGVAAALCGAYLKANSG